MHGLLSPGPLWYTYNYTTGSGSCASSRNAQPTCWKFSHLHPPGFAILNPLKRAWADYLRDPTTTPISNATAGLTI